ncbi:MAG: hypothetical protein Q4G34_01645 [Micrococcus sp.]|nr:hypothetical protein [Micrococcus sp.]
MNATADRTTAQPATQHITMQSTPTETSSTTHPFVLLIASVVGIAVYVLVRVCAEQLTGLNAWWGTAFAVPLSIAALLLVGTLLDSLVKSIRPGTSR